MRSATYVSIGLFLLCAALPARAQIPPPENAEEVLADVYTGKSYSPYADRGFATMPLWGDTHLHTGLSMDAGLFGARLGLEEAYRFARGEEVTTTHGLRAKLSRPLDWLVVSDHAEMYGLMPQLLAGDAEVLAAAMAGARGR